MHERFSTLLRLMVALLAVATFAAACGDDGGTETSAGSDTGSNDTGSSDASSDEGSSDASSDGASTDEGGADMEESQDPPSVSTVDCAEIQAAVEAAGDFAAIDPTGGSADDSLEASFNESRAALAALGSTAPEIADEVDTALEGLDALGAAFAEIGWNTDFSSDPAAGLQFAQTALTDGAVTNMIAAMSAISAWIATSCTS